MPQLDLTTYSSQIFWFLLCFIALYFMVSQVILPRIAEIIKNRKNIVDADLSSAKALDDKIYEIEAATDKLRKEANQNYQNKLEEAAKFAAQKRENMIANLKEKIDQNIQKSHQELQDLITKSRAESEIAITKLTKQITERLLSQ
ncbi:MAG: hypothetical protein EBS06_02665 [Proteobacteria bacterium]|nr:hypothetical protein [Pseudomonadota bacterium]